MKEPITKVIFRKFKSDGSIIALFPAIAGDMNVETCSSYMQCGQHSAASVRLMVDGDTIPAKREEYRSIAQELRRIGYRLRIAKTFSHADFRARKLQIKP